MEYTRLGGTGLKVSRLALGCMSPSITITGAVAVLSIRHSPTPSLATPPSSML